MKNWQKLLLAVGCVLTAFVLLAAGYCIYVFAQYYRLEDNLSLAVLDNSAQLLTGEQEYRITTLNMGFGAYDNKFSFFMDEAVTKNGKKVTGKYSRGSSKEQVISNFDRALNQLSVTDGDFFFMQEVDRRGDRSYKLDQAAMARNYFNGYGSVFAQNYDSAYLYYPFNRPIGKSLSGTMFFSRYFIEDSVRRSLPISQKFDKFFDLDRCISISRVPIFQSDKYLVLINVHLSAYDGGGVIRALQFEMLGEILAGEREKGNYIVVGGDFNLDLMNSAGTFPSVYQTPDWLKSMPAGVLPSGFAVVEPENRREVATCRTANQPYKEGEDYLAIVDGFIVSDNIQVTEAKNVDCGFVFSDHNPVTMSFKLSEIAK